MAKKDLVRLLVRLYGDPVAEGQFQKDRAKFLRAAKLAPKEQKLLVEGDVDGLRAYLGSETANAHIVDEQLSHIVDTALAHIVDSALGEGELVGSVIVDTAIERARRTKRPAPTRKPARKPVRKKKPAPKRPKPKKR